MRRASQKNIHVLVARPSFAQRVLNFPNNWFGRKPSVYAIRAGEDRTLVDGNIAYGKRRPEFTARPFSFPHPLPRHLTAPQPDGQHPSQLCCRLQESALQHAMLRFQPEVLKSE